VIKDCGSHEKMIIRRLVAIAGLGLLLATTGAGPAAAAERSPSRISVSSTGAQANASSSNPALSADGRYVAFYSDATNLVPGDTNGVVDIFVRDRRTGTTRRASVSRGGGQANGESWNPTISADGRYVAFHSAATNLVPGDTNDAMDIFVRDLRSGITRRVSVSGSGAQANQASETAAISGNGRYVTFVSSATNLVSPDTNTFPDVFVRDLRSGTTSRISVSGAGIQANLPSLAPAISADGRYVAFFSASPNLVPGDTNGTLDVFVRDRLAGSTSRVSVSGAHVEASGASSHPAISADGRYVGFISDAPDLVPGDTNGVSDTFVRDLRAGTTIRVNVSAGGEQANSGGGFVTALSADGRYVAFASIASNLVPGDTSGWSDVFVRDQRTGRVTRVGGSGTDQPDQDVYGAAVSADGRVVAFMSAATNLTPGDTNDVRDVFVQRR
jgi:Tol biopolymer transport system component